MGNPGTIATLSTQDTGRKKKPHTHRQDRKQKMCNTDP